MLQRQVTRLGMRSSFVIDDIEYMLFVKRVEDLSDFWEIEWIDEALPGRGIRRMTIGRVAGSSYDGTGKSWRRSHGLNLNREQAQIRAVDLVTGAYTKNRTMAAICADRLRVLLADQSISETSKQRYEILSRHVSSAVGEHRPFSKDAHDILRELVRAFLDTHSRAYIYRMVAFARTAILEDAYVHKRAKKWLHEEPAYTFVPTLDLTDEVSFDDIADGIRTMWEHVGHGASYSREAVEALSDTEAIAMALAMNWSIDFWFIGKGHVKFLNSIKRILTTYHPLPSAFRGSSTYESDQIRLICGAFGGVMSTYDVNYFASLACARGLNREGRIIVGTADVAKECAELLFGDRRFEAKMMRRTVFEGVPHEVANDPDDRHQMDVALLNEAFALAGHAGSDV